MNYFVKLDKLILKLNYQGDTTTITRLVKIKISDNNKCW